MAYVGVANSEQIVIHLQGEDHHRAWRIAEAACLQITDRVIDLYRGQAAPPRTSELERGNYGS